MSSKWTLTCAVALMLLTTPALAQQGKEARSNPGVQVLESVQSFNASRARLKRDGGAAMSELRAVKSAKGAQIGKRLGALGATVDGIHGGVREALEQLPGDVKSGKTAKARGFAAEIERRADSARAHHRAAEAAHAKGDAATLRAELDALELDLRAIERASKQLGLIEPVIHR
jgi:opacity protein-like surface antigen